MILLLFNYIVLGFLFVVIGFLHNGQVKIQAIHFVPVVGVSIFMFDYLGGEV